MNSTTLTDAMQYLKHGFSVIPLAPRSKLPPAGFGWKRYQRRRADEAQVRDWFDRTDFNVGIVCGEVSDNLLVRDFDDAEVYRQWSCDHPELASSLPTVGTARGAHVYFRGEGGLKTQKLPDGEIRGDGAYCVAPGSTHPDGRRYEWLRRIDRNLVSVASEAFVTPVRSSVRTDEDTGHTMSCVNPTVFSIEEAIQATVPQRVKTRDECLFKFARYVRALKPDATRDELAEMLLQWHRLALPYISRNSPHREFSVLLTDFLHKMKSVRRPAGSPLWTQALGIADAMVLPGWGRNYDELPQRLLKLCSALNQVHGGGSFPLGCRVAGAYLRASRETAAKTIRRLVADGVLTITSQKALSRKFAFEYRFNSLTLGLVQKWKRWCGSRPRIIRFQPDAETRDIRCRTRRTDDEGRSDVQGTTVFDQPELSGYRRTGPRISEISEFPD